MSDLFREGRIKRTKISISILIRNIIKLLNKIFKKNEKKKVI